MTLPANTSMYRNTREETSYPGPTSGSSVVDGDLLSLRTKRIMSKDTQQALPC